MKKILSARLRKQHVVNQLTGVALCSKAGPWPVDDPKTTHWSRACAMCLQEATRLLGEPVVQRAAVKHYTNSVDDEPVCHDAEIEVDADGVPTFACPHCADKMLRTLVAAHRALLGPS